MESGIDPRLLEGYREKHMVMKRGRLTTGMALIVGACIALPLALLMIRQHRRHRTILLRGAVIKQDSDTKSESPIANVQVSAEGGLAVGDSSSDFSGGFTLRLRPGVNRGDPITLTFRHPRFKPLDLKEAVGDQLYVARMLPLRSEVEAEISKSGILVSNVIVRYTTVMTSTENIGSGLKTFQIVNKGNVLCNREELCSPDGKWKASVGSASLDAGEGSEFRNARVACVAGPCPFTRIDRDGFTQGGRTINVTVRDWSDTATFLLQGDVFRQEVGEIVRQFSAVIFGRTMNFTLPPAAEGPSIVVEMNQATEVFALGPSALLSWADCDIRAGKNQAKEYRCELKAGYRFQ